MQSANAKQLVCAALLAVLGSASGAVAQGPTDFLRRIDENGNGMIDPEELEGRMGGFIRRMAENNPRIDLSRPIPLDRLTAEFDRMREERARSGGGGPPGGGTPGGGPPSGMSPWGGGPPGGMSPWGGGPPGSTSPWGGGGRSWGDRGGERGGDSRGGGDQGSPYGPRTTTVKPLVPAFGVETVNTAPPGFGAEGELFSIVITDEDRREAERAFRYYDRNQDGKIDAEEMKNSRYGADLPMYDRNRDGVITMSEMEYRYARLRLENTQDSRNRGTAGGERREDDGRRSGDSRERGSDERSGEGAGNDVRSYRRNTAIERLPEGLPDWFARDDADSDGQIAMHEFSTTWTDAVLAEFLQFDLNGDGLITPAECLAAKDKGAVRGGSIGLGTGSAPAATVAVASPASAASGSDNAAAATESPAAAAATELKIDARYMDYFRKVFAKYDSNNDGALTANEWASMSKDPTPADTDGDGRITLDEFARWQIQR